MTENEIAREIVDAAFHIHAALGPGLLESVYDAVLAYELGRRGLRTVRQQPIPVVYGNVRIDTGFRADLIVEDKVIVEVKSVEALAPVHKKQLLTYLRLADKRLGDAHQRRHHTHRQWARRRCSRQGAKPPRQPKTPLALPGNGGGARVLEAVPLATERRSP
jgi:GxxExxY protein